jgi:NitT/TauT family transport system substrate-binding protein
MHARRRVPRCLLVFPTLIALAASAAGCSSSTATATSGPGHLEKPGITVGVVPAVSNAGVWIAYQRGLFTARGLHVTLKPITSSADVLSLLLNGSVDILAGNYVSEIQAEANNPGAVRLHVLAEGALTTPHSRALMVAQGSPVQVLGQLKGKTIAVNALGNAASMLVQSALKDHGIPPSSVHLTAIPFPNEAAALNNHQVDAAWMTEPFISQGEAAYGLREVYDTNQGATGSFAIDGYVSTQAWARQHPHTAAAFIAALAQGQQLAGTVKPALESALETFLHITAKIAAVVTPDSYPTGVSLARMQRVADLMLEFGLLTRHFDMTAMTR